MISRGQNCRLSLFRVVFLYLVRSRMLLLPKHQAIRSRDSGAWHTANGKRCILRARGLTHPGRRSEGARYRYDLPGRIHRKMLDFTG
jgi:hypothetical protein